MTGSRAALELMYERGVDDDGWLVCTSVATSTPKEALRAVLARSAPITSIPEPAAVAVLYRTCDSALVDPSDLRPDVVHVATELCLDALASTIDAAAVAAAIVGELNDGERTPNLEDTFTVLHRSVRAAPVAYSTAVFADALIGLLSGGEPLGALDPRSVHHVYCAAVDLIRNERFATELTERLGAMPPVVRAGFCAGLLYLGHDRDLTLAQLAVTISELTAAGPPDPALFNLDSSGALQRGSLLTVAAARFVASGGDLCGPGSLAALRGLGDDIESLTDDDASALVFAAGRNDAAVSRFLEQWTDGGAHRRPIAGFVLPSPATADGVRGLSWRALLAATDPAEVTKDPGSLCKAVVTWATHLSDGDAAQFIAAVTGEQVMRDATLGQLPAHLRFLDKVPPALEGLVEASFTVTGLGVWVESSNVVRGRLTTAAAGVGEDRWSVIVSLLDEFRGTPEQLVELSAELAPTR